MELQGINKYPVLNRPDQQPPQKMAPPLRHQEVYPHYVQFATHNLPTMPTRNQHYTNNGAPMLPPSQHPNQKYAPSYQHGPQEQLPYPKYAPKNQMNPAYGLPNPPTRLPNTQAIPQHYYVPQGSQQPMNHTPEGAYYYDPTLNQYFQHATSGASTEYFTDMSQPLYFSQQSDSQELLAKYVELEKKAQSFKCVSIIHRGVKFLSTIGVFALLILLVVSTSFPNACRGLSNKPARFCDRTLSSFHRPEVRHIALALVVFGTLVALFHGYALQVYLQRRAKAMNRLHLVYFVLLILNIITLHPISIAMLGYLTVASGKLRKIFQEMEDIKTTLATQGIDPATYAATVTV